VDCDRCDDLVIDVLYGELDEQLAAELRRHLDVCPKCSGVMEDLKQAREAARSLWVPAPPRLSERAIADEREVQRQAPWYRKFVRAAAWAGSHAMHPQLAMAALFVFVAGSSLLLLRDRDRSVAAPVSVSERGAPVATERLEPRAAPRAVADAPMPESASKEAAPASLAADGAPSRSEKGADANRDCVREKRKADGAPAKRGIVPCPAASGSAPVDSAAATATPARPR
jgi:hypothetical protein